MYRLFFGLKTHPFHTGVDQRSLFLAPHVKEVLACLQYGIIERKGLIVVTGEVGTGKTTLLKSSLNCFPENFVLAAHVDNPKLEELDFLQVILAGFGIPMEARTKAGMLLQLRRWLVERQREGLLCALIVDEAQNLSEGLLEEIRMLMNMESSSEKLLQIVLCGDTELEEALRSGRSRKLQQRIALRCKTQSFTRDEARAYITERIRLAGGKDQIFSSEAVKLIHGHSKGVARLINLICEHALISAFVEQIKPIPARIVHAVVADLDLAEREAADYRSDVKDQENNDAVFALSVAPNPTTEFQMDRKL